MLQKDNVMGYACAALVVGAAYILFRYEDLANQAKATPINSAGSGSPADTADLAAVAAPLAGGNSGWSSGNSGVIQSQENGLSIGGQGPSQ